MQVKCNWLVWVITKCPPLFNRIKFGWIESNEIGTNDCCVPSFCFDRNSMRRSGYRPKPVHMIRENGEVNALQGRNQDDYDIKVFQYRKQQAELKR